jgi:DNA-binding winged helix-turn-helix (wHTH) protein
MPTRRLIYEFGPFRIDQRERLLRRGREVVSLPPKAVDLLLALPDLPGQAVTKDELLRRVWPGTFVEEGSLAQNVSLLRKALGDGEASRFIETIPRRGYRFVAAVEHQAEEVRPPQAIAVLPLANLSGDVTREFFAEGMTDELIGCLMRIGALRVAPRTSIMAYAGTSKPLREIACELDVD